MNTRAILDMTSQFDFYHGGGLDVCYLSFAEVDQHGNVGVHKFNGKIMGTGGFIDISATSKKIIFCGTLTAGSLKTEITDGKLNIVQEGRVKKFIRELPEITFSGKIALERGLDVRYITERAVFTLKEDGLHLIEIALASIYKRYSRQNGFHPSDFARTQTDGRKIIYRCGDGFCPA